MFKNNENENVVYTEVEGRTVCLVGGIPVWSRDNKHYNDMPEWYRQEDSCGQNLTCVSGPAGKMLFVDDRVECAFVMSKGRLSKIPEIGWAIQKRIGSNGTILCPPDSKEGISYYSDYSECLCRENYRTELPSIGREVSSMKISSSKIPNGSCIIRIMDNGDAVAETVAEVEARFGGGGRNFMDMKARCRYTILSNVKRMSIPSSPVFEDRLGIIHMISIVVFKDGSVKPVMIGVYPDGIRVADFIEDEEFSLINENDVPESVWSRNELHVGDALILDDGSRLSITISDGKIKELEKKVEHVIWNAQRGRPSMFDDIWSHSLVTGYNYLAVKSATDNTIRGAVLFHPIVFGDKSFDAIEIHGYVYEKDVAPRITKMMIRHGLSVTERSEERHKNVFRDRRRFGDCWLWVKYPEYNTEDVWFS